MSVLNIIKSNEACEVIAKLERIEPEFEIFKLIGKINWSTYLLDLISYECEPNTWYIY